MMRGPYRFVCHPAYFGELLMISACCMTAYTASWLAAPVLIACVIAIVLRIVAEERVLERSATYRQYAAQTRWRLIPGLW